MHSTMLGEHGADAKVLAGGQSLIPLMAFRLAAPAHLVDVSDLSELRYVRPDQAELVGRRHDAIRAELETAAAAWPAAGMRLREALPLVGHLPIRTRGTVGGSIAHADPTAELPLLGNDLDAEIVAQSRPGRRGAARGGLLPGDDDDRARAARSWSSRSGSPIRPPGRSACSRSSPSGQATSRSPRCASRPRATRPASARWIRVGLGAVASTPVRSAAAEAAYLGSRLDAAASDAACAALAQEIRPRGGLHVPAEYRAELTAVLLRRAVARIYAQSASAVSA